MADLSVNISIVDISGLKNSAVEIVQEESQALTLKQMLNYTNRVSTRQVVFSESSDCQLRYLPGDRGSHQAINP